MGEEGQGVDPAIAQMAREAGKKGGPARAAALTAEERSEIARGAAEARWSLRDGREDAAVKATHAGVLRIGEAEIPCYVLEDGRRVLALMGMVKAMGMSHSGGRRVGVHRLASFTAGKALEPFIGKDLAQCIASPVRFTIGRGGGSGYGYPANTLADICDAVLAARKAAALKPQQAHIAEQAEVLVRGFARVGIVALVDEATGYQEARARDELQTILSAYISGELLAWAKMFPDEFYREMFRLRGWQYRPITGAGKRPVLAGKLTNMLIYAKLPPGVLDELRLRNPADEHGRRRRRHHQFLTEEIGHPHLQRQIVAVTTLMKASRNWSEFQRLFNAAFPGDAREQQMDLESAGDAAE